MRLAVDPAVLAWALTPQGTVARAALLEHACFVPAEALDALRELRPRLEAETGLARGELWDLLEALLARVRVIGPEEYAEFTSLAARLVPSPLTPTLALGLALEVDAVLAGGPGFEAQDLLPVLPAWPRPKQQRL